MTADQVTLIVCVGLCVGGVLLLVVIAAGTFVALRELDVKAKVSDDGRELDPEATPFGARLFNAQSAEEARALLSLYEEPRQSPDEPS